jgi:hypothetical protein
MEFIIRSSLGCRVLVLDLRVKGSESWGFGDMGLGVEVRIKGFRDLGIEELWICVQGLGFGAWGSGV